MNDRYFACHHCKAYTSAGYRWAYWRLEHTGVVTPDQPVNVEAVLAEKAYWSPEKDAMSDWLYNGVFPTVMKFFDQHQTHGITYVQSGNFYEVEDFESWIEIEE